MANSLQPARTNWAGNRTYTATHLNHPSGTGELVALLRQPGPCKALGTRHSFNDIADTSGQQIALAQLDSIELDEDAGTVTVGAGITYGQLAPYLDRRGYALHNLASLPHISVVGGCSTATHGSGTLNGNLSTAVRAIELVTANGETQWLSHASLGERFNGVVVGLGALGIVTRLTLDIQPSFRMTQTVYQNLSFSQLEHNLPAIFSSGYSVSLFTDWQGHRANQVWIKRRVDGNDPAHIPPEFYGATAATRPLHPIEGVSAENCTEQLGIPGPWYGRLPHFRMEFTPSAGEEMQTEYFVPLTLGYQAIRAVEELRDMITPHLLASELRTVAADELWLSPACGRPSLAIHFTWRRRWPEVEAILPRIEAKLAPFAPRPHWAKLFTLSPAALRAGYDRMEDFKALATHYDPGGTFRNRFLTSNLFQS